MVFLRSKALPERAPTQARGCCPAIGLSIPYSHGGPIAAQIIYPRRMELTLAIILAVAGIATCAIVMAVMWGKEALAWRKRDR